VAEQTNQVDNAAWRPRARFGPATEAATKKLPVGDGLTADGVVGPKTEAAKAGAVGPSGGQQPNQAAAPAEPGG